MHTRHLVALGLCGIVAAAHLAACATTAKPAPTDQTERAVAPKAKLPGEVTSTAATVYRAEPVVVEGFEIALSSAGASTTRYFLRGSGSPAPDWTFSASFRVRDRAGGRQFRISERAEITLMTDETGEPLELVPSDHDEDSQLRTPFPPPYDARWGKLTGSGMRDRHAQASTRLASLPGVIRTLGATVHLEIAEGAVTKEIPIEPRDIPLEIHPGVFVTLALPEDHSYGVLSVHIKPATGQEPAIVNSFEIVDRANPGPPMVMDLQPRGEDAEGLVLTANFNAKPRGNRSPGSLRLHIVTDVKPLDIPVRFTGVPLARER
jgi:hypothetical protein